MAYTALTVLTADRDGVPVADAALTDALAGGHTFVNDGQTALLLQNTNGSSRTVTVQSAQTVDGLAVADLVITVPATTGRLLTNFFPPTVYRASDGLTYIDVSATAGLKVAAVRIPREVLQ